MSDLLKYVPAPMSDELIPHDGRDWPIVEVASVTDGDTVRIRRTRIEPLGAKYEVVADSLFQKILEFQVIGDLDPDKEGRAARLINLDTPERGDPNWQLAKRHLKAWCDAYEGSIRCITYNTSGGFDRLLVDLYTLENGMRFSATEFMLKMGWPPFVK